MARIVVIGGGIAGIGAALELASPKHGHHVYLLDKRKLGSGTSSKIPGRMGHGFHYFDIETAKAYLYESIRTQRKYPNFLIGSELPESDPIRHGRYFITKNSTQDPGAVRRVYEAIQQEYARLVAEDRRNKVFGDPDKFLRILKREEYAHQVNEELVAFAVETNEHLFNCKKFFEHIRGVIQKSRKITLIEDAEVFSINRGSARQSRFVVNFKNTHRNNEKRAIQADIVVNSSLDQIEKLNNTLGGIYMEPDGRTNRLKCILTVKLPESLAKANSMFFCFGKHCMLSNLGNGTGMMTYADITNMEACTGIDLSPYASRLLNGEFSPEEYESIKRQLGAKMLEGGTKYIPELANAEYLDVGFGIVQTKEAMTLDDLSNPKHGFNIRDYDGVREELLGFVSNPGIKYFYFNRNGRKVAKIVDHELAESEFFKSIINRQDRRLHPDLKKAIHTNIELYSAPKKRRGECSGLKLVESIFETREKKKRAMQQLEQIAADVNVPFKEAGTTCQMIAPVIARKIANTHESATDRAQIAGAFYLRTKIENETRINAKAKKALINNFTFFSPIVPNGPSERNSVANTVNTIIKTVENKNRLLQEFKQNVHDANLMWQRTNPNPFFLETLTSEPLAVMDQVGLMFLLACYNTDLSLSISGAAKGIYSGASSIAGASASACAMSELTYANEYEDIQPSESGLLPVVN